MEDIGTALASVAALGDKFTGSKQLDLILRDNLQAAVRRLGYALETPGDSIQRISYLVCFFIATRLTRASNFSCP